MVFDSNRLAREERKQDHRVESSASVLGCALPRSRGPRASEPTSLQQEGFPLACLLSADSSKMHRKNDNKHDSMCTDNMMLRKKCLSWVTSGSKCSAHDFQECLLPGLHDDVALECIARTSRSDYPSLSCLNRKFRELISNRYLYKLRRQLGIVENWVYVACIMMPWEAFDPGRKRWMRLPIMPCDDCFSLADKESLAVRTELLVFGRESLGFTIWKYSLVNHNWSKGALMKLSRCMFGSGSFGNYAIIAGGNDQNGRFLMSAELYNSDTDTWESLPDMNMPRKKCSGFFMDKKFYIIGGMSSKTDSLTCGEEFDLETRTWRRIPDMYPDGSSERQSPPLVAVVNNQLYAADQAKNEVKKYDKASNTWNFVKPLPVRADSYNGWGLAFKACGDRLIVIAGHRGPKGEVIVFHCWCPDEANGSTDWQVLSVRERAGAFVQNCAVMGC